MPSHSRRVSSVTSVRKFWDLTARFNSPSSTNSNAFGARRRESSSKNESRGIGSGDLVQAVLLDLVEKRLVADPQMLCGFLAIPPRPRQHPQDQFFFRLARRCP